MKMYEAVTFVPPRSQFKREGKFTPVFRALSLVSEGKYLPVECRSANEASHLKQECTRRGLTAERRMKTVFIQGVAGHVLQMDKLVQDSIDEVESQRPNLDPLTKVAAAAGESWAQ